MKLLFQPRRLALRTLLLVGVFLPGAMRPVAGQVTPNEILNPDLKVLEEAHFQQLIGLNQSIVRMKFPFSFYLSRYVGLDPAKQMEMDSRGLEFVRFQDRQILKISGNYNAAYNAFKMTQNERAANTFHAVVLPILNLVTSVLPPDIDCDGIGFEISHHARTTEKSYDFEGKEILVVILDRQDAWAMSRAQTDADRQEILNRNKVFMSGADFGLSLTERDPLLVQSLPRSIPSHLDATSTARSSVLTSHSSLFRPASRPAPDGSLAPEQPAQETVSKPVASQPSPAAEVNPPKRTMTQKDADYLEDRYKPQLAVLAKEGVEKYHFVSYAPPAFVIFHDQVALQLTMKNTLAFGPAKGSIYKRAAQSFDLYLAPLLKDISSRISWDVDFQLYDFSVLNKLSPTAKETSEAIEYICPRGAIQQFVNAEITNQQLLDQSVVLVNGVRIALNLQLVE
jgi:hypothetical protein